ncbi:MAG TPA: MDR family MFS transporter [Actinomycetes bacterium]|jgi:EmrB/QacA subfamily drug resistance transporter|nr:MDR family MFS transporter [Actinomycetes bacterium]
MTTPAGDPQPVAPTRQGGAGGATGPGHFSHRQIVLMLFGVMAGMLLAALDQGIVGTALPRIVSELGGLDRLSWVVTAYLLTSTASTPLWGKISDLYGRRLIFQVAIGVFLLGSALSGLSQTMTELIGFRALQGIGGGGLFAIALSIIGDVIAPRERGRYQGYFGAVFGISSVAGPLLGGWFTDGPGWRWIFYVNLPIGFAALVVTSIVLKLPVTRREHRIDYLGAATIVAAVSCLLLYLNWRGEEYGWTEAGALALLAAFVLLAVAFVVVEARSPEPIIPLRLFRNSVFSVGNFYGFLSGVAMFGAIIFLPVYLQAVKGLSPTASGLALLPAIVGIFSTSISSGRLITKTGRYRIYPIIGAVVLVVSMYLLSRLGVDTPYWRIALYEYLFGAGLGFTIQTIVTAVQNAVEFRDLGAATSSTTFFRQMGGSIGAAVFGAVLASRLTHYLSEQLAQAGLRASAGGAGVDANNIQAIQQLHEPVKAIVLGAFTNALDDVFLVGVPFILVALVVSLFLKELPLRTGPGPAAPGAGEQVGASALGD